MAFAGYARNGEYQQILGHVSRATINGQAPFFMMLDANSKKEEVQAYLEKIGMAAVVMVPTNGDITCHQGNGSMTDYMVISTNLRPLVERFEIDHYAP